MDVELIKEYFTTIQSDLESKYSERNETINEMDELRFSDNDVEVPSGLEKEVVQSSIAYSIVENVVGTLTANDALIRIPPSALSGKSQQASSDLEKWTVGAFTQLRLQQNEDVFERFLECLVAYGHGCMRMLYAPQLWRGFPKQDKKGGQTEEDYNNQAEAWKQGRPLPMAWTWCDPRCVYPSWSDQGLESVLEVDHRDPLAVSRYKFNLISDADLGDLERTHLKDNGDIEFAQLWTRDSLTYAIDGVVVHQEKHKYPSIPYVYALGQAVASKDPARMGLSVLYPLRKLLPYLDRLLTQKASAIRLYAWPTVVVKQGPFSPIGENMEGDDASVRQIEVKPGQTVTLFQGEEISFLTWQGDGPDIDRQISLIMEMCDRAGIPGASMGVDTANSGYAINQLIGAARMKLKPLTRHGEDAYRQLIRTMYDIVEYRVKQPVPVYLREKKQGGWLTIGPDDLKGYRHVEVTLNPLLPTDTYARSSQAINEYNATIRSRRSAREMVGIEQPEDEENQRLLEMFLDRPEIQQVMSEAIVRKFGFAIQQQQALSPADMVQRGMQLPGAYQQAITDQMQGQPTNAAPPQGATAPQGQVDPQAILQALQQGQLDINAVAQMVAQGALDLNALGQLDPNLANQILQMLQQQGPPSSVGAPPIGGGVPAGGGPMGANLGPPGPNMAGGPPAAVMSSPITQAGPGTPQPNSAAGARRVGPTTRPSGGPSGVKRR
jgi:hypothetical protein